jgi:large subunit ribosomal protein L10
VERSEKQAIVDVLKGKLAKAAVAVVCDFKGIKVAEVDRVRSQLRNEGVEYQVVKNTLVGLAMNESMRKALDPYLVGPTAIAFTSEDPTAPARILTKLAKDIAALKIKAGYLEGRALNAKEVDDLASMPGKPVLQAKLLGLFAAPATGFVRVLSGVPSQFVRLLAAREKSLSEQGGAAA